jgi:GT2 family glycosyltransferase
MSPRGELVMTEGELTGIVDGAVTGWIESVSTASAGEFQLIVNGEPRFTVQPEIRTTEGRIVFNIPLPTELRDGRIRYIDVQAPGADTPLAGGPVAFDGGMFDDLRRAGEGPRRTLPIDGRVKLEFPGLLKGHAWSDVAPEVRVEVEIWSGDCMLTSVLADELQEGGEAVGDGRHGFTVDLSRLLKGGPHQISVHPAGSGYTLDGGRLEVGPFDRDGWVGSPGYLEDERSIGLVSMQPFEHLAYNAARLASSRLAHRLVNRLRSERNALAGARGAVALILLDGRHDKTPAANVWRRQSYPKYSVHLRPESPEAVREIARRATFVFFAAEADVLHPSAGTMVMADSSADAVVWHRFCADEERPGSPGTLLRRPDFDPITWRHGAVTDTTIAVKGAALEQCPDDVLAALCAGRLHPLYFWLAGQPLSWRTIPEALTVQIGPPTALSRREIESDLDLYVDMLGQEGDLFVLNSASEEHPFPFFLTPARRAEKISVLICYRDKPELTLRCLHSISLQHLTGELEVVLVDNQSSPTAASRISEGARMMLGAGRVVLQAYDAPFNHSAENNLAARAASGEVIVVCNNDTVLEDRTLLEQLGAWALQPSIGAVGCRLDNPRREAGSYGHAIAPLSDDPFRAPLQENDDPTFADFVHASPGVTMALAAMSRERFLDAGGLDEVDFPNGYNDIEFMLRCSEAGLRHLYVGHVHAQHARGSTRSGENEDRQALLVNQRYPAVAGARFRQLTRERLAPPRRQKGKSTDTGSADKTSPELAAALEARRELEAQRKTLAEAIRNARDLAHELDERLAVAGVTALGD